MSEQTPITDSPWFWVLLFSVVGLMALAAISGQYGKRQARLERQYQARERVAENAVDDPAQREFSTADNTLIRLMPLAAVLGAVAAVAAVMLFRERRRRMRFASRQESP